MELKCVELYSAPDFDLRPGMTTAGLGLTEDRKVQMLTDYPGSFVEYTPEGGEEGEAAAEGEAATEGEASEGTSEEAAEAVVESVEEKSTKKRGK